MIQLYVLQTIHLLSYLLFELALSVALVSSGTYNQFQPRWPRNTSHNSAVFVAVVLCTGLAHGDFKTVLRGPQLKQVVHRTAKC